MAAGVNKWKKQNNPQVHSPAQETLQNAKNYIQLIFGRGKMFEILYKLQCDVKCVYYK